MIVVPNPTVTQMNVDTASIFCFPFQISMSIYDKLPFSASGMGLPSLIQVLPIVM